MVRGRSALRWTPQIARHLEDASIVEVMPNPDGRLWIDRLSAGLTNTGGFLSAADGTGTSQQRRCALNLAS